MYLRMYACVYVSCAERSCMCVCVCVYVYHVHVSSCVAAKAYIQVQNRMQISKKRSCILDAGNNSPCLQLLDCCVFH